MSQNKMFLAAVVIVFLLIGLMSVFTVKETELALKLRFGKVDRADYQPGLHFKWPFINQIRLFDARIQTVDAPPEQFLTEEKKNLIVDTFIKWRITELVTYFITVSGRTEQASQRLSEMIADGLRSEFGKRTIQEVISGDRDKLMTQITEQANSRAQQFGINVIDVRIKRIELPKEVSHSVYRRMEAERERVAKDLRSRGEAAAVRIRAQADRESIELLAKAERDAEKIRGEGDAQAAKVYAQAYSQDQEFYSFYRSLNGYRQALSQKDDILLLKPDSDFFNYFKHSEDNAPKSTQLGN